MTHGPDSHTASLENTAAPDTAPLKTWLTRPEAAAYLTARGTTISKTTLAKLACLGDGPFGDGPDYQRFGNKALYTVRGLDKWIEKRMSAPRASTSQVANGRHEGGKETARQPADPGAKKRGRPRRTPLVRQNEATAN